MQKGRIYRKGNLWMLQFWKPVIENGTVTRRRVAVKLADYDQTHRTLQSVAGKAQEILAPINAKSAKPESNQLVADFIEHVYLPHCESNLRPSTCKAYHDFFNLLKPHLPKVGLDEFEYPQMEELFSALTRNKQLAHTTHRNLKSFMSGVFRHARKKQLVSPDTDPVRDLKVPRGKSKEHTHAYSLADVLSIMEALPEPANTVVLTAAFTGLRMGELKGLKWTDFHGNELYVERSVWGKHIQDTKTLDSRAAVPIVPMLRKALEAHHARNPKTEFVFTGATGKPMRLENLARRIIIPTLEEKGIPWHGYHAFRRGVGTALRALGVDLKTISEILRHGDTAVTEAHYVGNVPAHAAKAMAKLAKALKKK